MSKAINWPSQFLDEVINEKTNEIKVAFRLGNLYYDHHYYVEDEVVDIRVNHKVIRQGQIIGNMRLCKIKELSQDDFAKQKSTLKSVDDVVHYLADTYNEEVGNSTVITVIYYKNLELPQEIGTNSDPHM